jgi:hypothetical protein
MVLTQLTLLMSELPTRKLRYLLAVMANMWCLWLWDVSFYSFHDQTRRKQDNIPDDLEEVDTSTLSHSTCHHVLNKDKSWWMSPLTPVVHTETCQLLELKLVWRECASLMMAAQLRRCWRCSQKLACWCCDRGELSNTWWAKCWWHHPLCLR